MAQDHYQVLGVSRTATADELRSAYLGQARVLHPDRYVDAGPARRAEAERDMQALNEAWRVLGNGARRFRYDAEHNRPEPPPRAAGPPDDYYFATRRDGTTAHDLEPIAPAGRVIRGLPWLLLMGVLALIFVFTAYAVGGSGSAPNGPVGGCVTLNSAGTAEPAPCRTPGARRIVVRVKPNQPCPTGTERFQPAAGGPPMCLEL
ncbi:MAG: J domain-containing protein [Acidimicrobiia bacterium]